MVVALLAPQAHHPAVLAQGPQGARIADAHEGHREAIPALEGRGTFVIEQQVVDQLVGAQDHALGAIIGQLDDQVDVAILGQRLGEAIGVQRSAVLVARGRAGRHTQNHAHHPRRRATQHLDSQERRAPARVAVGWGYGHRRAAR